MKSPFFLSLFMNKQFPIERVFVIIASPATNVKVRKIGFAPSVEKTPVKIHLV